MNLFSGLIYGLEVNEKMTFSILNLSETKKTILMNKGIEYGLKEGDHAKFYTTSGIVARAVLSKGSPNRSVWSVYKIVDDTQLNKGNAFNLKITAAVKITDDPFSGAEEQRKIMEGNLNQEQKELLDLKLRETNESIVSVKRPKTRMKKSAWEIFGEFHYSMLNQSTKGENIGTKGSSNSRDFTFGVEYYLFNLSEFIDRVSVTGFVEK